MLNFNITNIIYKNLYALITSTDLSKLYVLGFMLGTFFGIQIASGLLLSFMYYVSINNSWYSVLSINDFEGGYLIRSVHITGTSFIYLLLYLHIFKVFFQILIHNSSLVIWIVGIIIYFLTVVIAFIGYVLPCTQMSYWGLTVFSNILSTVPLIGIFITYWIWGSEFIQDYTLIKVHALHIALPLILIFFIIAHLFFLHFFLSSENFFDRLPSYSEKTMFVYYFFLRDTFCLCSFLIFWIYFITINWTYVFHEESWEIVSTMKTSEKIIPEWFFLTFFGFIKAVPSKALGMLTLVIFVIAFFNSVFFLVYNFLYIIYNLYYLSACYIIISLLYFIGSLSTNVTLLFPLILQLQMFVMFIILYLLFKFI